MIDTRQVDRLLRYHDPDGGLLTLSLTVPADVAGLREMWVRLERLLASVDTSTKASARSGSMRRVLCAELDSVRETLTVHARDWLDHGVTIVRSIALGVDEHVPVGWPQPERVVVGRRPYVRPLLAALHQADPYVVAVVDRRHSWVFRVEGHGVEPLDALVGRGVRDRSYGGWAGLEEYRVRHRADELVRQHYRSTAAHLGSLLGQDCHDLVVGGHEVSIVEFVDLLPDAVRRQLAGTFVVDPHAMTPVELRTRSAHARSVRRAERARQLRSEIGDREAGGQAVSGAVRCVEAVNRSQADLLLVAGDGMEPGFVCDGCGALAVDGGPLAVDASICARCGSPARRVVDLVDEMVVRVMAQHGQVQFVGTDGAPTDPWVAARLRGGPLTPRT